jgi:hypothetical protein
MRNKSAHALALAALGFAIPTLAHAATPSFVVKCMRTAGPAVGSKYGTFYFYLRDGVVKGFVCGVPGQPCQIISQDSKTVVFDTPGEAPDRLTIDLRTGAVQQKNSVGIETAYSCRQIPYQE